ncbi:MAG TPA: UvrD-helicase domain-containing protein [Candidatus Binatia bacterium]|nr:UvrD-helicase domain-containing protein [Candidatus Binatia bacterium]
MSEAWDPTPEQRAAVVVEGAAVVRAGAGCGKTAVLAERFVHLLRPRAEASADAVGEVGEILAVTFTEKAAAEMKRKIRDVVAGELARAEAPLRPHWLRVRRELLGAQISTIHAFCARVLRENPLEAGVDPRATVLDDHESRTWIETAVETALLGRLRAGDVAARELVLRRGLSGGRTGGAVGLCADFLATLARMGRDADWLVAVTAAQADRAPDAAADLRRAAERIVAAVETRLASGRDGKRVQTLAAAWPRWRALLDRLGAETPLEDFVVLRELRKLLGRAGLVSDVAKELVVTDGRLRGALPDAYGTLRAHPENVRLAELIAAVGARVRACKREDSVLTFDDLIVEARAVLAAHGGVRARYVRRFRAILVDEFQDTDRVQADVIRILASDGGPALFVVGDERQSIYRFRGADVAVFAATCREVGTELALGTNFRSVPGILDFVNALAARIFAPAEADASESWTRHDPRHRLVPRRTDVAGTPAVRVVSFVAEHAARALDAAQARELEARVLAGVVERLHVEEGVPFGDIAVLFRVFTEVKTYENALRRREIPYYVVKGRGFFQCQEVTDVVSLLAAVLDSHDELALAAALRSPLFAVDDDLLARVAWPEGAERPALARRFQRDETFADLPAEADRLAGIRDVLRGLRTLASRATIAELLEAICAATDFEAVCLTQFQGPQKVANVRKLIELGREWERKRFFSLREFVRTVRRLAATEPREAEAPLVGEQDDVVRLMTIHQAKGLEFPVVLVPDLGRVPKPDYQMPALDESRGVVGGPIDATGWVAVGHAGLEAHRRVEIDRERAEQARLLYVACTRAKNVLVLLEGKGDARALDGGGGDRFLWCHQVWDVVGRAAVAEFAASDDPERVVASEDAGAVRLERAGRYVTRAAVELPFPAPRTEPARDAERAQVARVLGWAPPAAAEVVTSPTALADFRRCPRQYWYRHVLRIPERGSGGGRATRLGTAAHAVLETVGLDGVPADVDALLRGRPEVLGLPERDVGTLSADLRTAVEALRAEIAGGLEIVGREVPFVLALPAGAPSVFLHGRIDLVGRRAGARVVRDFKYARPTDAALEGYGAQLAAYRLALQLAEEGPVDAEVAFLRGGTVVRRLAPRDTGAEEVALVQAGAALGRALAAGAGEAFPRQPPSAEVCTTLGCGYVRRCWGR